MASPFRVCEVPDCEKRATHRTLCAMHAWRLKHHGDLNHERVPPTMQERILSHAAWDMETGCWLWTAFVNPKTGYGMSSIDTLGVPAHRVAFEAFVGPIPDGLEIDHLCHTFSTWCPGGLACPHRRCVNPVHLEAVTRAENARRRSEAKTHCPSGHPYSGDNLYRSPSAGHRQCRACLRIHDRERTERLRLARAAG